MEFINAIVIGISHPYKENSNVWIIDILQINDAKNLLNKLSNINDDKTKYTDIGYLHLAMSKDMYERLHSIHPRSVPKIIYCNCVNNICGQCFVDWNGKEHYNNINIPHILEYKILFEPRKLVKL